MLCQSCGFENPLGFKFCGECGTPIAKDSQESKPHKKHKDEAERRQLTVMFCDLVGSTSLSEQLDPEDLRDIVRSYQDACAEVIDQYHGYIGQYLGDGLLVYFGYPVAHEDDAQRAVRAGLEIVRAMHELPLPNTQLQQTLQVRVGIHTGLVVAGEMGGGKRRDPMAIVGETPNIAARLQGLAEPNTVVISTATFRMIEGLFECHDLGTQALKGISTPVRLYQVLKESGLQSRIEVAVTRGLTPLVGREQEVELLLERWERVKEGEGQVLLLNGEPGIGKSRLVQVLKERISDDAHVRLESYCSPYYQNSSLYPVIDHLQRFLGFSREESSDEKVSKLEMVLEEYGFALSEAVPLFASLLSMPIPDRYPALNLSPQRQKEKTLEGLLSWLLKEAGKHPVLDIVEDLHWVDPSTLEFLSLLVDQVPAASIFTLFTSRPDFSPPWASRAHLSQITLSHLTRKQVEIMIEKLAGGEALSANVTHQIVTKTDGVPLFVEELTKTVLESRNLKQEDGNYVLTGLLPSLAIPSTLQDSLMARLDRLATGKEVAQLGATIGREFTYELLQAVSPLDEATLQGELTRLVEAELLYQRGIPPRARYFFKHALIQDAAYQSLLKSKRQRYHQKIAEVLEERFPETEEIQPELLAHHYTEAGLRNRAIVYWQMAGHRAIKRSANVEGASHLTKGLKLLETLPGSPERTQLELDLQTALGPALTAIKGWGSSEVEKVYNRARELCQQVGETPQLFWVLWGLWAFYATRGESQTTRELAEQLLSLAQNQQDSALLLEAHTVLGNSLFWLGELASARAHMEQGIALYEFRKHRSHAFIHGHEPGVFCLFSVARVLWYLGYPDQALKRSDEAITLAQEMSHPFSLAWALYFATALHQCRRERQATHERAEAAIALCTEQGFAQWLAGGTILRGWALAELGQRENGIAQMRQGLVAWRATGSERARPYFLSLLAETYGMVGQAEEGLAVLDEVLNTAHKNGDRYYEAELYRLKGELLLGLSQENHKDVETCFRRAIDVARSQNGKSLELRAVVSLSRLWQKQGKKEEARQMLSEIYDWFTEGFNTRDLKEAKALLEDLQ